MANSDPQLLCDRLFTSFLAPLVLGGTMRPTKALGGKTALAIGDGRSPSDVEALSLTHLARVRVARKLAPVDRFDPAPTGSEWALATALHDLVQTTHPGFNAVFRRSGPRRILSVLEETIARIPSPRHAGEALSRHTWFSRMFALARTDIVVRWWTGSETFLGAEPPARLTAWPELRRVEQTRTPRPLMDLPMNGAAVDGDHFTSVASSILARSPLTDLATLDRAAPRFEWRAETLTLTATAAGRTLVLRALQHLPSDAVHAALGAATRTLFATKAVRAAAVATDLLRDRALMVAAARMSVDHEPDPLSLAHENEDASFAVSVGAMAASEWIAQTGGGFGESERKRLLRILAPAATSTAAGAIRALLSK